MRIRFFPSGTPGYPQTDGVGNSPAPQYRRIHDRPERLKYFAIAEKTGDVDQDVPVKQFHLIPVLLKDVDVGAQVLHSPQRHASHDAATWCRFCNRKNPPGRPASAGERFAPYTGRAPVPFPRWCVRLRERYKDACRCGLTLRQFPWEAESHRYSPMQSRYSACRHTWLMLGPPRT